MIDLDAYFARIGYTGPRAATLPVLRAIHALHPAAIPFENLDPLLGRPVPLDIDALQVKMVAGRRGGYCFEHNTLFQAMLEALGFRVTALTGRVRWMAPPDAPPGPRTHMVLRVDLDQGPFLADVGFGLHLAATPLRLEAGVEQKTPSATVRLAREGGALTLQILTGPAWRDVYRFTLDPQLPVDIEVGNWFTASHPSSRFRNSLMVQRVTPEGRVSLLNRRLVRRDDDGRAEERILDDPEALAAALVSEFGIEPPADPATLFARIPDA